MGSNFAIKGIEKPLRLAWMRNIEMYNSRPTWQIAGCINLTEDSSIQRSIHNSRGDKYGNGLVKVLEGKNLDFLTAPDLDREDYLVL